ncbi:FKBP-type peptidyl-prolyl cis-trans isomerase [Gallaecimonas mangrovi]|uniref:FKBP-type peptidyl-prolyl cis-trans isomerase n=1 Tax=Gallaecimonas mangrovi TaxID=2291597 RepID=UPI000E1FBBF8|nr:FKBP-type peptidyl-prolyl cis-trans isomerase [Gallaecimonas mangrovi]
MKPWFKLAVIPAFVLAVTGCQQQEQKVEKTADKKVELKTDQDKQAYAIGASVGQYIRQTMDQQEKLGIKLSKDMVISGFEDAFHEKTQLDADAIKAQLQALDKEASEKQAAKSKAEAEKNKTAGEKYLADNAKKDGVKVTKDGLQYQVLKEGKGPHPKATDRVTVNYKGTLIDGTQFDSSYDRGEPITFALNRVIPGWTEGVQLMTVGSKYRFVIPADLAYGDRDMQTIPPNSTLVFEVELLKIDNGDDAKKSAKK